MNEELVKRVPAKVARKYHLMPLEDHPDHFEIAIEDPHNLAALDEVELLVGKPVKAKAWPIHEIEAAIRRYYGVGAETVDRMVRINGE